MSQAVQKSLERLEGLLGPDAVITGRAERFAVSTDLWPRHLLRWRSGGPRITPAAVIEPTSIEALVAVVKEARKVGYELVPYGAGSSVVGGATPEPGQVVVDLKRLDSIRAVDTERWMVHAEAGVNGEVLDRELKRQGWTQGHYPSSIYCSTVGGWIAARGAGQFSSRYGKIEDQVLGARVVTGQGKILEFEPNVMRSHELDQWIGNEGRMGFWVDAWMRIRPLPEERAWDAFDFPDLKTALACARAWLEAGLSPSVLRIYDPLDSLLHKDAHHGKAKGDKGPSRLAWLGANFPKLTSYLGDRVAAECRCILGLEGSRSSLAYEVNEARRIAGRFSAKALGEEHGLAWYDKRYAVGFKQANAMRAGVLPDTMEVACTWSSALQVYDSVRTAALARGAQVLCHFSHAYLDGVSLYFTFAMRASAGDEGYFNLWSDVLRASIRAGGNVTHHHGTGKLKAAAQRTVMGELWSDFESMVKVHDDKGIMNPRVLAARQSEVSEFAASYEPLGVHDDTLLRAHPDDHIAKLTEILESRGRTLGSILSRFPTFTVRQAVELGIASWRDPQLNVVEPSVADVATDGQSVTRGAPRAAQGPDLRWTALNRDVTSIYLKTSPRAGWIGEAVAPSGEAVKSWLVALSRDATLNQVGFDARRVDGENWVIRASAPNDSRAALFKERVRLLTGTKWCWDSYENMSFKDMVNSDQVSVASGIYAELEPLFALLDTHGKIPVVASAFDLHGGVVVLCGKLPPPVASIVKKLRPSDGKVRRPKKLEASSWDGPRSFGYASDVETDFELRDFANALDNCTYCPKLCRFACPTARTYGTESVIPRQLMLTTQLHRNASRRLDAESASRLYACVDCGACTQVCDHGNEVSLALTSLRRELATHGEAPAYVQERLASIDDAGVLEHRWRASPTTATKSICITTPGMGDAQRSLLAKVEAQWGEPAHLEVDFAERLDVLVRWGGLGRLRELIAPITVALSKVETVVFEDAYDAANFTQALKAIESTWEGRVLARTDLLAGGIQASDEKVAVLDCCRAREPGKTRELLSLAGQPVVDGIFDDTGTCCGGRLGPEGNEDAAMAMARRCGEELLGKTGATKIVAESATCSERLKKAGFDVVELAQFGKA